MPVEPDRRADAGAGEARWIRTIKNALRPLARTPLHPQWLALSAQRELGDWIAAAPAGSSVLDIGCGDRWPRTRLPASCRYVGVDYPRTSAEYGSRPDLNADAHRLPLRDASVDVVLMLDVLEHLRDPEAALREVARVMAPGARLVLQVPFLYPIHDAPADYSRWTVYGHRSLAGRAGLQVVEERSVGEPVETAALLANIAVANAALLSLRRRHWTLLLAPAVPVFVLAANLLAWLMARLLPSSALMPFAYRAIWSRPAGPAL